MARDSSGRPALADSARRNPHRTETSALSHSCWRTGRAPNLLSAATGPHRRRGGAPRWPGRASEYSPQGPERGTPDSARQQRGPCTPVTDDALANSDRGGTKPVLLPQV